MDELSAKPSFDEPSQHRRDSLSTEKGQDLTSFMAKFTIWLHSLLFCQLVGEKERPCAWLGLEVQHRAACLQIDRHRDLIMHEQPLASDLAPASGPTSPETELLPSGHGCATPVEAVGEGHVIAHRDRQVSNFKVDRTLDRRERLFPSFLNASAPTYCSGGTMSNDTSSGAYMDITPSRSFARCASTYPSMTLLISASSFFLASSTVIGSSFLSPVLNRTFSW